MDRTWDFYSQNRGSTPLRRTNLKKVNNMANKKLKSVAVKTVPAVRSQRYVSDLDPLNIDPTNIETIIKISLIISVILAIIVIL